jgi:hypothetical protein
MQTSHTLHLGDARHMTAVADASVQLIVTSPPYPMVAMWDEAFAAMVPEVAVHLAEGRGLEAFAANG